MKQEGLQEWDIKSYLRTEIAKAKQKALSLGITEKEFNDGFEKALESLKLKMYYGQSPLDQ